MNTRTAVGSAMLVCVGRTPGGVARPIRDVRVGVVSARDAVERERSITFALAGDRGRAGPDRLHPVALDDHDGVARHFGAVPDAAEPEHGRGGRRGAWARGTRRPRSMHRLRPT